MEKVVKAPWAWGLNVNATVENLRKPRLKPDMPEHPVNPETKQPTEFRAAVIITDTTNTPLKAYQGITGWKDVKMDIGQGLGDRTFYCDRAQMIATNVAEAPDGKGARLTGHSLGGGMASAGSRVSGLPATTFNPAGLHAKTVPHPVAANIDEVYVKGEPLHGLNAMPVAPDAAATRTWPLDPPSLRSAASDPRWKVRAGWRPLRSIHAGGNIAVIDVPFHMMDNVDASLSQRRRQINRSLQKNGYE
ncbi:hypothetical protein [Sphingomonas parapaucimobilis]|uniref:hypothetical protein n=1 Tax=Sphingomonas parapaucimobilis TaxID=28213 RepID=UPI0035C7C381